MQMTPLELWKSFVESFARLHDGVHKAWVVERGQYPLNDDNAAANTLLASLTLEQRETLAEMLVRARRGGVHDALVILNDRMALNDGAYSENGIQMEFQPFDYTLYQDYVGQRDGYDWEE
jgi:hypothetical protein